MATLEPHYRRTPPSPLHTAALLPPSDGLQCAAATPSPFRKRPQPTSPAASPASGGSASAIAESTTLRDMLLLSPTPLRRSRQRLSIPSADDARKRRGSAGAQVTAVGNSPRNSRRARRRLVEKDDATAAEDDGAKARRRKSGRTKAAKKEELSLVAVTTAEADAELAIARPSSTLVGEGCGGGEPSDCAEMWEQIVDLSMWRNASRSALWFGVGSTIFLSSSFSGDLGFSIISAICHLAVALLAVAFLRDTVVRRQQLENRPAFRLTEEDVLRAARVVLPVANSVLAKLLVVFSGDPATTLKVLPVLIFGAKYGSLITFWRLFACGFFALFTAPKLYTCYSLQIHRTVTGARSCVLEAWKSCPRKRFVAVSAATVCWNMVSVKTRIVAALAAAVILRYYQQHCRREEISGQEENGEKAGPCSSALGLAT